MTFLEKVDIHKERKRVPTIFKSYNLPPLRPKLNSIRKGNSIVSNFCSNLSISARKRSLSAGKRISTLPKHFSQRTSNRETNSEVLLSQILKDVEEEE